MPIHSARVRPFGAERPLMFAYYGTRGALPKLTLDLAREASGRWNNACTFSLATSNELYDEFSFMQDNLFAVNTFASPQQWQSITCVQRVKSFCADLSERVANDKTRAIVSLMEELEAVDWYNQRAHATGDPELAAILEHHRDEEKEHATMLLEWLRRRDPALDRHMKTYLFSEGSITEIEHAAEAD